MDSRSVMPLLLREGRLDCPAPRRSARPLRAGEVGYHGVHDAPISAFMMPRSVFTMLRSGCSRSPDPGVQDGPKPAINASLNATATVLLGSGYVFIRRRRIAAHRACMIAAFAASSLFLITYLIHHAQVGSVPFHGAAWLRPVYFGLLVPHIVLAALVVPLALTTIHRAWRGRFDRHRQIARVTLPIWLYVSVSGVLVYVLLYHFGR